MVSLPDDLAEALVGALPRGVLLEQVYNPNRVAFDIAKTIMGVIVDEGYDPEVFEAEQFLNLVYSMSDQLEIDEEELESQFLTVWPNVRWPSGYTKSEYAAYIAGFKVQVGRRDREGRKRQVMAFFDKLADISDEDGGMFFITDDEAAKVLGCGKGTFQAARDRLAAERAIGVRKGERGRATEYIVPGYETKTASCNAYSRRKAYANMFKQFWNAYPVKTRRRGAVEEWKKLKPNELTFKEIMAGLEQWKRSECWCSGMIHHAANWLEKELWKGGWD